MIQQIACAIIIVNGKILLNRKVDRKYFVFPGGKIKIGETPQDAIVRELREEFHGILNIEIQDKFKEIQGYKPGKMEQINTILYFARIKHRGLEPNGNIDAILWHNGTSQLALSIPTSQGLVELVRGRYL